MVTLTTHTTHSSLDSSVVYYSCIVWAVLSAKEAFMTV